MEREIEGYLAGLPTCGPDLRHPVPPITSLFHLIKFQMGGRLHRKSLGNVSWERRRELLEGKDGQVPAGITLALTREIWGRGGVRRFEMYDSIRAEQAKGLDPHPSQLLTA